LLQVYFHSRIAEEHESDPFNLEDVARGIADKLIRRHPHVFGDVKVSGVSEVIENWEQLKAREKDRNSATDGIALSQPALPLVTKLLYRAEKIGIDLDLPSSSANSENEIVDQLISAINAAIKSGIDPEDALRLRARAIADEIQRKEAR
jgi:XTP/dITP diphosphohydrolase